MIRLFQSVFRRAPAAARQVSASDARPVWPPAGYAAIGAREEQQDAHGVEPTGPASWADQPIAVVADGIGGLPGGAAAARGAVAAMLAAHRDRRASEDASALLWRGLGAANRAVHDLARSMGRRQGEVGSTLVAVALSAPGLDWISVGDSRAFLFRDGALLPLTTDHNVRNKALREAERVSDIAARNAAVEHARNRRDGDALTSFVGLPEIAHIEASDAPLAVMPGDRVLLSSDGVHGVLTSAEIEAVLAAAPRGGGAEALGARVAAARRPHQDNATAVVVDIA